MMNRGQKTIHDLSIACGGFPCGGFPRDVRSWGGGTRADVGTLQIVHFKVLVFPHPWGIFILQSPQYLVKPSTQLDLKMHF